MCDEKTDLLQDGDDDIVTLMTTTGEKIDFVEIAGIVFRNFDTIRFSFVEKSQNYAFIFSCVLSQKA